MGDRYTVMPHLTYLGMLSYAVVDTATGARVREYDCQPFAEREVKELNESEKQLKSPDGRH